MLDYNIKKPIRHIVLAFLCLVLASANVIAQSTITDKKGIGLTATGSDKLANTIYTNPGQDCSTEMNISWVTPPGMECLIELTNESDSKRSLFIYKDPELCQTFDSIHSKLANNADVYERHVFDKHGYDLHNLQPDTKYKYRIITTDPNTGNEEYSDYYRFKTAGADAWKAAVIGDFHHYAPMWFRLDAAMGMLDVLDSISGGLDWVLSTGDQNAWGGSFNFWTELSEQPQYKNHMWAAVQGNHDHETRNRVKSDAFFRDSHFYPRNGYEGQEGVSYWFKYGDVLFFMLNNEAMRTRASLDPVFEWMEEVVEENPTKYLVVVQHYNWLIGTDGSNSQLDRFREEFDKLGVDIALSGHNHAYLRTYPIKNREVVEPGEGTFYVVNSSSDRNRGRALKPLVANKNIIEGRWSEGSKTVGAMLMDVDPDRIVMTLYDEEGNVQDTFTSPARR